MKSRRGRGKGASRPAPPRTSRFELETTPSTLTDVLRSLRTLALRGVGPIDRIWRRARGADDLPPLWLRRHTGAVRQFVPAAKRTLDLVDRLELLSPTSRVLDIGCGCGAMALRLAPRLSSAGRYVGFDVHAPSIDWCERTFAEDARYRFALARIRSPYSVDVRETEASVEGYRFPCDDGSIDLALAKSVFTHMDPVGIDRYLEEIRRILAPSGRALVSFFLFAETRPEVEHSFPYSTAAFPRVRWRQRRHPLAAIAYERGSMEEKIAAAGLEVVHFLPGFWPGSTEIGGQDQYVLRAGSEL